MPRAKLDDQSFIRMFEEHGANYIARNIGVTERNVYDRRSRLEGKIGRQIQAPNLHNRSNTLTRSSIKHPGRIEITVKNGTVLVGSDCHYWPGEPSAAHRAFVKFCKQFKPEAVILNGDVIDAATVSRHPPIGWEKQPTVQEEIEVAQERLHEVEMAAGKARKLWPLGNHDGRFETRLATVAPEYARVHGVHLRDHFPLWEPCWSVFINDNVVVKHRFKGGIHATHNNTMWSGRTMITGHLHSAKVTPLTDYNGTRYGVDTGCIADPSDRAFLDYTEDNPKNWRAAFCLLTFRDGRLMMPELVLVIDQDRVEFRGEAIKC